MRVMDFEYLEEYITEEYQQQVLVPRVERLPILLRSNLRGRLRPLEEIKAVRLRVHCLLKRDPLYRVAIVSRTCKITGLGIA